MTDGTGRLVLALEQLWRPTESFGVASEAQRAVLRRLALSPCAPSALIEEAETRDAADIETFVDALYTGGWLMRTVTHQGRPFYTVQPVTRSPVKTPGPESDLVLSDFAAIQREGDGFVIESPLAWARIQVHDPELLGVLGNLSAEAISGRLPAYVVVSLMEDLRWTGLAVPAAAPERHERRLRQWSPHELRFHWRSRRGNGLYDGRNFGRTDWAKGSFDPLPAPHPGFSGPVIALPRPNLDRLRLEDPSLATVVEDRRSIRAYDDERPITVEQLGELLFRCARVRETRVTDGVAYVDKPHPSGGSVGELELYPVVRLASGLKAGLYHYNAHDHALTLVRDPDPQIGQLLLTAARASMQERAPQVLLVIAARFGRLMLAYEEMPYSLVLKHVGVMYHNLYLATTAMGLAGCGLGGGDADAFSAATGLDPLAEASVGEFMLGSRPSDLLTEG